jgi:hypothetical protein
MYNELSSGKRINAKGQSRQSTGARGGGAGPSEHVEERVGVEELSGHNTALIRHGLIVVLLS